jgi:two-component sensor histidine kinase
MILHELGTNAVKYGALCGEAGTVEVTWVIAAEESSRQLRLEWRERGGPPVAKPTRKGFGSTLISKALSGNSGSAELDFSPSGVTCRVNVPIGNLS